jgi:hypothetical protein
MAAAGGVSTCRRRPHCRATRWLETQLGLALTAHMPLSEAQQKPMAPAAMYLHNRWIT